MQRLARSYIWVRATFPACGAKGHGRLTGITAIARLLAVALQSVIAEVVLHPPLRLAIPARAMVQPIKRAALEMRHLKQVHVSGFSKPEPQTQALPGQHHVAVGANADTCELLGETVPAMHEEVGEGRWEWRERYVAYRETRFPRKQNGWLSALWDARASAWKEGWGFRAHTTSHPRHQPLDEATRVLATCPACGHGRLTAVARLLLAVALQGDIALVVPHPPIRMAIPARACVHVPRWAALSVGHLVRERVPGFSKPDPQTHSQHKCEDTGWQLGETVPAMH